MAAAKQSMKLRVLLILFLATPVDPRAAGPRGVRSGGIATYPFPRVDGHAPGVENLSAAGDDSCCIADAAVNEALTQPAQEALTCLDGSD